jgi:ribonucleoside-diphosphate reductase alpha chain
MFDKNRGLTKATLIEDYGWKFAKESLTQELFEEYKEKGVFVTTEELTVNEHLEPLKVIAHYTNQSLSKTVNLPNDYPFEDFKNLYFDAWKSGIKGITTYRAGSMTAVLESKDAHKKIKEVRPREIKSVPAAVRPKEIPCDVYNVSVKGEKYTVLVGLLNGKPYEIFATNTEALGLNKSLENGIIKKLRKSVYVLTDSEGEEIANLSHLIDNPEHADYTRMISTMLRHGVSPDYIVEQIEKVQSSIVGLGKAMGRVLKHYISAYYHDGKVCENCGGTEFIYQEGCSCCKNCGHSKCG